ncbi:hypothetical protein CYMTET_41997 [Cymbomonas tetramitiformis]|uniref:Uncharacterized protein n=1 Tax=Cymbomonas tetramitiformis TaxID=36881 RepID=A0AAE0C6P6_9CHLO|nr:hypothetical protein CYMTET_41997 [Cymbomonas tetramitiformis]
MQHAQVPPARFCPALRRTPRPLPTNSHSALPSCTRAAVRYEAFFKHTRRVCSRCFTGHAPCRVAKPAPRRSAACKGPAVPNGNRARPRVYTSTKLGGSGPSEDPLPSTSSVALFDLDRTLIDCDSGWYWIMKELRNPEGRISIFNAAWAAYVLARNKFGLLEAAESMAQILEAAGSAYSGLDAKELTEETHLWFKKIYSGTEGEVADTVLTKWLAEFDTTQAKNVMTVTAKLAAGQGDEEINKPEEEKMKKKKKKKKKEEDDRQQQEEVAGRLRPGAKTTLGVHRQAGKHLLMSWRFDVLWSEQAE